MHICSLVHTHSKPRPWGITWAQDLWYLVWTPVSYP